MADIKEKEPVYFVSKEIEGSYTYLNIFFAEQTTGLAIPSKAIALGLVAQATSVPDGLSIIQAVDDGALFNASGQLIPTNQSPIREIEPADLEQLSARLKGYFLNGVVNALWVDAEAPSELKTVLRDAVCVVMGDDSGFIEQLDRHMNDQLGEIRHTGQYI